ncbi:MAG: Rap1a/Tai family immunity protein [Terriglobales bacterium]
MKSTAVLTFLLLSVLASAAQSVGAASLMDDGNHFLSNCDRSQQTDKAVIIACLTYVQWVKDGASVVHATDQCVPQNAVTFQLLDISMKFIRDNPETRDQRTAILVHRAIVNAFPCEK